jgi:para-aminobenzoate synthetase component 1
LSPERFIRVEQNQALTEPIKGTRPRGQTIEEDEALKNQLAASEKDRAENVMIVDLLRNDFGKNCRTGSVRVPKLFALRSFPAVHHLVSTITGELAEQRDALHLLQGAFPGGSITGAPKVRAMEIIEELEPHRRASYCGSIGYYDFNQRMDSNIAIRTLITQEQPTQKQIHCWAGGGLVADSDEQMEYEETLHKVSKLLPLIKAMSAWI